MKEAMFYRKVDSKVVCKLCPRSCILGDGETGNCGVRKNVGGKLYSLSYGKIIAMHADPIEKKPLFHLWPGSLAMSIATPGCNLHCLFCQNWEISQIIELPSWSIEPERVVEMAIENRCHGIAYTYTEPTVFFEFAYETAKLAKKEGLYNAWVSNGMINEEPIKKIARYMDAANIDLKAFTDRFYREICGGVGLKPVLEAIKAFHRHGVWVELTTLLIPGENDSREEIEKIVDWVSKLDRNIPLHFSRFHPMYRMVDRPPTPVEKINEAVEIAKKKLNYVYAGNVWGHEHESTYCPKCGCRVIKRIGFSVVEVNLNEKRRGYFCPECGEEIPIIGRIIKRKEWE